MKAGKDVYCEKPLTLTIEEALAMKKAVAGHEASVLQTGSQQRDRDGRQFRLAAELVRAGRIGKVEKIECRIGGNPTERADQGGRAAEGTRLGHVARADRRRCRTGSRTAARRTATTSSAGGTSTRGGKMTDWGAHHIDIAQWCSAWTAAGRSRSRCSRPTKPYDKGDGYNCHPNFKVQYTYANGVKVIAMAAAGPDEDCSRTDGKPLTKKPKGKDES